MKTQEFSTYNRSSQILLGFESLYPSKGLIPKVRFAMESLTFHSKESARVYSDFFMILKNLKVYPLTPVFERLIFAKTKFEEVEAILKLMDHLSQNRIFEDFRLLLTQFQTSSEGEETKKLLVSFLKNRSVEAEFSYCEEVVSLFLEENELTKIKKMLDFYYWIYEDEILLRLKKAYEHFVNLDTELQFYAFLHDSLDLPVLDGIKELCYNGRAERFEEAFSKGQIKSKIWAVETLLEQGLTLHSACVLCGWYGVLPSILMENGFEEVSSIDIDSSCKPLAERLNKHSYHEGKFQAITENIFNLNYRDLSFRTDYADRKLRAPEVLINTSCEHIENFASWYNSIPDGQLLLLQSNNYFDHPEHVNCVNSTAEFREQTPMANRLFSGTLPLEKYTRYMVIGYK